MYWVGQAAVGAVFLCVCWSDVCVSAPRWSGVPVAVVVCVLEAAKRVLLALVAAPKACCAEDSLWEPRELSCI